MHRVRLFLPGAPGPAAAPGHRLLADERDELLRRFGGVTAYSRAPARGLWRDDASGEVVPDDIVVLEVMVPTLDAAWWAAHRAELERRFGEDEILVLAHPVRRL